MGNPLSYRERAQKPTDGFRFSSFIDLVGDTCSYGSCWFRIMLIHNIASMAFAVALFHSVDGMLGVPFISYKKQFATVLLEVQSEHEIYAKCLSSDEHFIFRHFGSCMPPKALYPLYSISL